MATKKAVTKKDTQATEVEVSEQIISISVERFNPMIAELNALAKKAEAIETIDIEDKDQVKLVHDTRMELVHSRTSIEKIATMLRETPKKLREAISGKEAELIGIISTQEDRLEKLENDAKDAAEKKKRLAKLPERKGRLAAIEDGVEVTDEYLLTLDANQFEAYLNKRVSDKNRKIEEDAKRKQEEEQRERLMTRVGGLTMAGFKKSDDGLLYEYTHSGERVIAITTELLVSMPGDKWLTFVEESTEKIAQAKAKPEPKASESEGVDFPEEEQDAMHEDDQKREAAAPTSQKQTLNIKDMYRNWRTEHGWTEATKGDFKEEKVGEFVVLYKKVGEFCLNVDNNF